MPAFIYICTMYKVIGLIFFSFLPFSMFSQDTLMPIIFLDDVVISEENNGFSIEDFVEYVKQDTTFYMAFKHLRYYTHKYNSELNIFDKNGNQKAVIKKWGTHYTRDNKAWIVNDSVYHSGRLFKKNGDNRYYTVEAFDDIFFPNDTINVSLKISKDKNENESKDMRDARTIGFSVGSDDTEQNKGGASKKLAIFDISMQQYYDYIISDTIYKNKDCYSFIVQIKENLSSKDKKEALIRKIVSFFDKENFHIMYREYEFVYNHLLFDLDMNVAVYMDYVNKKHVPVYIYYKGFWKVVFYKAERSEFILRNEDYIVN